MTVDGTTIHFVTTGTNLAAARLSSTSPTMSVR